MKLVKHAANLHPVSFETGLNWSSKHNLTWRATILMGLNKSSKYLRFLPQIDANCRIVSYFYLIQFKGSRMKVFLQIGRKMQVVCWQSLWISNSTKHVWKVAMHLLHQILRCHKHNILLLFICQRDAWVGR